VTELDEKAADGLLEPRSEGAVGRQLRSARWFANRDLSGFIHRSSLHAEGISRNAFAGRPIVGICNSWSELVSCNLHFRGLADAVKRGVLLAGGLPLEFPTISLGEALMKPTAMLYRNLMSMDVEESLRSYPLDAVVLIGGCDKTIPAQLMGAASAGIPAIMMVGGPSEAAYYRGQQLGGGTDLWHFADELRAGRMTEAEFDELEAAARPGVGTCNELGTASTMAAVVEAIGMCLPGTATIPAVDAARTRAAEATGARAVELARSGPTPAEVLTADAFTNAITVLAATGGSTNAVLHLLALAGRVGVPLTLDDFQAISARVPLLANVRPSGEHLFEDMHRAGGVPALLNELQTLLETHALTVTGASLGDGFRHASTSNREVIASLSDPFNAVSGVAVVRGTLAPSGAIIKRSAASPHLLRHRGPAVVFEDVYDVQARIDDESLRVTPDSVLVLRNSGPMGGPGMPEWGQIPIPRKLLVTGVSDMVRVSDARMSGTAFGTVVLHVAPESAAGGPLALVQEGDPIVLDVGEGRLDLDVPAAEIERRRVTLTPSPDLRKYGRGYGLLYLEHVLQANEGCDFDFLRGGSPEGATEPYGLLSGWVGGW
jgi:dihydroxy-acid dehydratase